MPSVNAQADIALDWKGLLDSTERYPDLLPSIQNERDLLLSRLGDFQAIKARQQELTALRQEATQQLNEIIARGKETALSIRSILRGKVGPWNELLVHFAVAPIRRRPRMPVVVVVAKSSAEPVEHAEPVA